MVNIKASIIFIHLFFMIFSISFLQARQDFNIKIDFSNNELNYLNIKKNDICESWIPSLISPLLIVPSTTYTQGIPEITNLDLNDIYSPVITEYKFNLKTLNYSNLILGKEKYEENIKNCYFGLCFNLGDYVNKLTEEQNVLELLKENNIVENKIFSFNNWTINNDSINTAFYLGDVHENFILNDNNGIIGSCEVNTSDPYWGCSFKKISFNNKYADLINGNESLYKIYFSSENYNIIFPESFKTEFDYITNNGCKSIGEVEEIFCKNLFGINDSFPITLINDNMNITIEIDNVNRFSLNNDDEGKTRIKFKNNDFILPLIMFKNFHIQFDGTKNIISFYTNNKDILQVKKEEKKKDSKGSSKALTAFLIILIIIIIAALVYLIFWFIKRRRRSVEKNINKYNKFEDEDNFQNMNDKRVF